MNNNTNTTPPMPEYVDRWTAKMVEIWRDRLDLLGVYHTGNLRQSVTKGNVNETDWMPTFRFSSCDTVSM